MWWPFKKTEARQQVLDASAVYARAYSTASAYGGTPVELVNVLESPDASGELRREARYLARSCPFLISYLRAMNRGCLPGLMPPMHVSPRTAAWWSRYWRGPVGVSGMSGVDFESLALRTLLVDGEFFVTTRSDDLIELVAADEVRWSNREVQIPYPGRWRGR